MRARGGPLRIESFCLFAAGPAMRAWLLLMMMSWAAAVRAEESAWRFDGYGTLGTYRADDPVASVRADYRNRRASRDGDWRFDGDSLLAAQMRVQVWDERVEAVWQLLAQDDQHYGQHPRTEWLYLGLRPRVGMRVLLGRSPLPAFLQSETRHVGYSMLSVRPVNTVYQLNPFTHMDGAILRQRFGWGEDELEAEVAGGRSEQRIPVGKATGRRLLNLALRWDRGPWSLRASRLYFRVVADYPGITALRAALIGGATACSNCAERLDDRLPLDFHGTLDSLSLQLETAPWTVLAEWAHRDANSNLGSRSRAWYVLAGRRFGAFVPYAVLGEFRVLEPTLDLQTRAGAPAALVAVNQAFGTYLSFPFDRRVQQLGLRWDWHPRAALKLQWERWRSLKPGASTGQNTYLVVPSPPPVGSYAGPAWDGRVQQWTLNLDFVY